ncbi:hypothetical protein Tco_1060866 [Tanacetum coccineum]
MVSVRKGLLGLNGGSCGGKRGRGGSMAGRGDGCDGVGGGEFNGGGVVLGVFNSLLSEIPDEVIGERGGDMISMDI